MLTAMIRAKAPLHKLLHAPVIAIPVTIGAGVCNGLLGSVLHGLGASGDGLLGLAAGIGVTAGVGYLSGRFLARRDGAATNVQRGTLIEDAEAERARPIDRTHQRSASFDLERGPSVTRGRRETPLTLCGVPIPPEDETKHFKIIGTTGTGKSTAIGEVLQGALSRGDRAIVADPDGGYLRRFYDPDRGDVILNPFVPGAAKWDIYGEIANDYDVEQLARSLIPDHGGSERSWREYARTFLSAVVEQTRAAGIQDPSELFRLLTSAKSDELRVLLEGTTAEPFLDEHNTRMFDSIRSVTVSAVGSLRYVGEQEGAALSVRDWVNNGRGVLFIPYEAGQIAALRSTVSAWMRLAIFETMNREAPGRRLWFVVDELDALGQIDGLKDALARLRKFGGSCLLGFQSIAQVSGTYGQAEAQTIVENCSNTVILRCAGSEHGGTSQFASRLIGQREVLRTSESRSRQGLDIFPTVTRSDHLHLEPAVLDSEIEQLPDLKGFLKLASSPRWLRVMLTPYGATRPGEVSQLDRAISNLRETAKKAWEFLRGADSEGAQKSSGRAPPSSGNDLER
jgi:type IV secretory pathway TraG/TraD family ATPase VirD4